MRKLYFSNGSPYARKVRILLHEMNLPFEEDIFDRVRPVNEIKALTPSLQVPVYEDNGMRLFGSNLILRYLYETYPFPSQEDPPFAPTMCRVEQRWDDELILETIETMANSLIGVRLLELPDPSAVPYVGRQMQRVEFCLDWLEERNTGEGFWPGYFSVMDMNLMCPLLYGEKRRVFEYRTGRWPNIASMINRWSNRRSILATPLNDFPVTQ